MHQLPGSLDLCGHIRQLGLNELKLGNGLAKLHPFLTVLQGFVQTLLGQAKGCGTNRDSRDIQNGQELFKPIPSGSDEVFFWYADVVER